MSVDAIFLTPEQVRELTGYRRSSCQVRWLQEHGIRYFVHRSGRPVVLRTNLEPHAASQGTQEPDWQALRSMR